MSWMTVVMMMMKVMLSTVKVVLKHKTIQHSELTFVRSPLGQPASLGWIEKL